MACSKKVNVSQKELDRPRNREIQSRLNRKRDINQIAYQSKTTDRPLMCTNAVVLCSYDVLLL